MVFTDSIQSKYFPLVILLQHILFQKYTSKLKKVPIQPDNEMELVPKVPLEKRFVDQSCDCSNQTGYERDINSKQEL